MRCRRFIAPMLALLLLGGCSRRGDAIEISDPAAALEAIRTRHEIPGMAAVALRGGTITSQIVAGVRKAGAAEKITRDDQFHLGSDTKAMTATLVGLLVDEGKLKWTTTLGEVFGDAVPGLAPGWKPVTLDQVLGHRSGFPANTDPARRKRDFRVAPVAELRREFVFEALTHPPEFAPGGKFEYSNTGYIVIGAALEKITGQTWDDLIRERLFKPLGITTAGFGPPGTPGHTDQPWGHRENGAPIDPGAPGADNPAIYGPAGTVHMTLGDWSKFVALHLRGDPANPHRQTALLQPATMAHLHAVAGNAGQGYTSGWGILTRSWARGSAPGATGKVLTHAGSNTFWLCVVWVAPEIDFAVLVACNRGGDEAAKACDEAAGLMIRKFASPQS